MMKPTFKTDYEAILEIKRLANADVPGQPYLHNILIHIKMLVDKQLESKGPAKVILNHVAPMKVRGSRHHKPVRSTINEESNN